MATLPTLEKAAILAIGRTANLHEKRCSPASPAATTPPPHADSTPATAPLVASACPSFSACEESSRPPQSRMNEPSGASPPVNVGAREGHELSPFLPAVSRRGSRGG